VEEITHGGELGGGGGKGKCKTVCREPLANVWVAGGMETIDPHERDEAGTIVKVGECGGGVSRES